MGGVNLRGGVGLWGRVVLQGRVELRGGVGLRGGFGLGVARSPDSKIFALLLRPYVAPRL